MIRIILAVIALAISMSAQPTISPPVESPATTTTIPDITPTVEVDLDFDCDNFDTSGAVPVQEPIIQDWRYSVWPWPWRIPQPDAYIVVWEVLDIQSGTVVVRGTIDPATLPTPGYHDNWIGQEFEVSGHTWLIASFIDGQLHSQDAAICP